MLKFRPEPWRRPLPSPTVVGILLGAWLVQLPLLPLSPRSEPLWYLTVFLGKTLLTLLAALYLIYQAPPVGHWREKLGCRRLRLRFLPGLAAQSVLLLLTSLSITWLWRQVLIKCHVQVPETQALLALARDAGPVEMILLIVLVTLAVPALEELLFRRLLYGWLLPLIGFPGALALQAAAFAVMHNYLPGLPALLIFSVLQQRYFCRCQSLTLPILAHGIYNAVNLAGALLFSV